MIIRENETAFTLIRQHDHAAIAESIIRNIQEEYFPVNSLRPSVLYAIKMHDCGWENFDKEPFWNDEQDAPYSFIDFPVAAKAVLYKHGIDMVEKEDSYATLLCSEHYSRFLVNDNTREARNFIESEQNRQAAIKNRIGENNHSFRSHYELLQLADNLSLYLCLNKPGSSKATIHPFFNNGIPVPKALKEKLGNMFALEWMGEEKVVCNPFPFKKSIELVIPCKKVTKASISRYGFRKSYARANNEEYKVKIVK